MVEINEEIIEVMKKIKDAVKDSTFYVNRFSIAESGTGLCV